jgi:hypothetical protein
VLSAGGQFDSFLFPFPLMSCQDINMDSGRHFDGEEAFNTGPMAPPSEPPANVAVTKL